MTVPKEAEGLLLLTCARLLVEKDHIDERVEELRQHNKFVSEGHRKELKSFVTDVSGGERTELLQTARRNREARGDGGPDREG